MSRLSIEEISGLLKTYGIHKGFPQHRQELADRLVEVEDPAFSEAALKRLFAEAELQGWKNPCAAVSKWLRDGGWMEIVSEPAGPRGGSRNMDYTPDPQWQDEYDIQRVLALALYDRKSPEFVAQATGKSVDRVLAIVREHGPRVCAPSRVSAWLDPEENERQLREAVKRMRSGKGRHMLKKTVDKETGVVGEEMVYETNTKGF